MRPFRTYLIGGGVSGALVAGTLAAFLSVTTFISRTTLPTGDTFGPARDVATIQVGPLASPAGGTPSVAPIPAPGLAPSPSPQALAVLAGTAPLASAGLPQGDGSSAPGDRKQGAGSGRSASSSASGVLAKRSTNSAVAAASSDPASKPRGHAKRQGGLRAGVAKRGGALTPGLAKKGDGLPPGLAKKAGGLAPGQAKPGKVAPGHARKHR